MLALTSLEFKREEKRKKAKSKSLVVVKLDQITHQEYKEHRYNFVRHYHHKPKRDMDVSVSYVLIMDRWSGHMDNRNA